jgi:hypothetical protein
MNSLILAVVDIPKGAAQGGIVVLSVIVAVASINAIKNMTAILVALGFGISALSSMFFMFNEAVYPLVAEFEGFIGVDRDLRTSRSQMDVMPSLMDGAKRLGHGEVLNLPGLRYTGGDAVALPTEHPAFKWSIQGAAIFLVIVSLSLASTFFWWLARRIYLGVPNPKRYHVLVDGDVKMKARDFTYSYPLLRTGSLIYDLRRAKKMDRDILKMPSGAILAFQPVEKLEVRPTASIYR